MDYRLFKKTGAEVSLLGFGNMRLPKVGKNDADIDVPAAQAMIDAAYAGGVNYFDTAYGYHSGASEPFIGQALKKYPRASFFLATKLPMWHVDSRERALALLDEQLARCQVDYFDFYLMHSMNAEYLAKTKELDLYALLDEKRRAGKIRNLGFSFHDKPAVLEELCSLYQWDFVQIQLNYHDWDKDAGALYGILEKHGIPCIVMEPVRGGRLAALGGEADAILKAAAPGASIASWAFRYVAALPNVLCVLSGMSDMAQVQDNLATFSGLRPMSADESAALEKAIAVFRKTALIPCTACRYCMPCPSGVDIPGMFKLHNDCAFDGTAFNLREKYAALPPAEKAGNCVACRNCEKNCPQQLQIAELMAKIDSAAKGAS